MKESDMLKFRLCSWMILLLLPVFLAMPLSAKGEVEGAASKVKEVLERAMEIQTDPDLFGDEHRRERARLVRELIADNFHSEVMARNSLGEHWNTASVQQRNEFKNLFIVLFQDSYTRMVLNFLVEENIDYGPAVRTDGIVRVPTTIMRISEHIPVEYSLSQKGGHWLIEDVEIDGVSIVNNYKNSFGRAIRAGSLNELIKRMRTQKQAITADEG